MGKSPLLQMKWLLMLTYVLWKTKWKTVKLHGVTMIYTKHLPSLGTWYKFLITQYMVSTSID